MANKFVSRTGLISLETSHITGSLFVSQVISASNLSGSFYGNGNQLFFGEEQQTADVRYLKNFDFNEFSASVDSSLDLLDGRVIALEQFSTSLDDTFATELEVSGFVNAVSTSFKNTIDSLSESVDFRLDYIEGEFSQSVDTRLDDLEAFSTSLDDAFATEEEVSGFVNEISASFDTTIDNLSQSFDTTITNVSSSISGTISDLDGRVVALEEFSTSLDDTFATEQEVSGFVNSVSASFDTTIDNLSQSIDTTIGELSQSLDSRLDELEGNFSASVDTRLDNLEAFSTSLDDTFATELEVSGFVNAVSASFDTTISNLSQSVDTTINNVSSSISGTIDALDGKVENISSSLDSRLDELEGNFSASVDTRLDDLEAFSTSIDATFATEQEVSGYVEQISASFDTTIINLSQSVDTTINNVSSSISGTISDLDGRVVLLEAFSTSLDDTFATELEVSGFVNAVSASIDTTINNLSQSVDTTITNVSSSFDTTINNLSQSIDTTINNVSSSISGTISDLDGRVVALEAFSTSLDDTFATELEVSGYTHLISQSILNDYGLISGSSQLDNTTVNGFTLTSVSATGSFTGSFIGDGSQLTGIATSFVISGSDGNNDSIALKTEALIVSGVVNETDVTIDSANNTLIIGLTDDVTITNRLSAANVGNIDGSTDFTGSFSGDFTGDGSGLTNVTIANATTYTADFTNTTQFVANHTLATENVIVAVYDEGKNVIIPQNIQVTSDSQVVIDFSVNTTGYIVIAKAGHVVSGSFEWEFIINKPTVVSGSSQITISDTTGYTAFSESIDTHINTKLDSASFDNWTSSVYLVDSASFDTRIDNLEAFSTSLDDTFATELEVSGFVNAVSTSFVNTIDGLSSSLDSRLDELEVNFSTSVDARLDNLEAFSTSLDDTFATELEVSGFVNAVSTSFDTTINNLSSSLDARLDVWEAYSASIAGITDTGNTTGTNVNITTIATGTYDSMFFDYVVKDGNNLRAGTIISVWDSAGSVQYFDNSTQDLGSTTPIALKVNVTAGGDVELLADITSGNWTVKATPKGL
jgi:hypothetical protein